MGLYEGVWNNFCRERKVREERLVELKIWFKLRFREVIFNYVDGGFWGWRGLWKDVGYVLVVGSGIFSYRIVSRGRLFI